jgi:hypothetical protein
MNAFGLLKSRAGKACELGKLGVSAARRQMRSKGCSLQIAAC